MMNVNEMTKAEYAQAIANEVGGKIQEVTKNNGLTRLGVTKEVESGVAPVLYIDEAYENGEDVMTMVQMFNDAMEQVKEKAADFDWLNSWDNVKDMIRVKLINKRNTVPVSRSAKARGFSDLIMVPYLTIQVAGRTGSSVVTDNMIERWGVTKAKVFNQAIKNIPCKVMPLAEQLAEMSGMDAEEFDSPFIIVTTPEQTYGAAAIIKAREKLKELCPNGYYVIPSSIHEVLVIPKDVVSGKEELDDMVKEVNMNCLNPTDVLSDRAYEFAATA